MGDAGDVGDVCAILKPQLKNYFLCRLFIQICLMWVFFFLQTSSRELITYITHNKISHIFTMSCMRWCAHRHITQISPATTRYHPTSYWEHLADPAKSEAEWATSSLGHLELRLMIYSEISRMNMVYRYIFLITCFFIEIACPIMFSILGLGSWDCVLFISLAFHPWGRLWGRPFARLSPHSTRSRLTWRRLMDRIIPLAANILSASRLEHCGFSIRTDQRWTCLCFIP